MNEENFNLEIRKYLKKVGITSQREIEKAVTHAIQTGRLRGDERLKAHMVLKLEALDLEIKIDGEIALL
jgi:hypothetical protein